MHSDDRFSRSGADVKNVIRHIDQLPAPPSIATKILTEVMDGDADFAEISKLIESDPALTLKVLKIANSMEYGYRGKITSVESAIATIGFSTLKNAMLSVIIRETFFSDPNASDPEVKHIWKHTLACAVAAELIAEKVMPERQNLAFAAGMVHDCGKLVLLMALPNVYEKLLTDSRATGEALLDLETETLGMEHTQAGKLLMQKWGLPEALRDAAWLHHQMPETLISLGADGHLAAIVQLADFLAHEVMADDAGRTHDPSRDDLAEMFHLDADAISDITQRIGDGYALRADIFDLEADSALFYFEALQRANSALSGMNTELADTAERLRRAGRILDTVGSVGPALIETTDVWDVFLLVSTALRERLGAGEGFIYRIDADLPAIEGLYFTGSSSEELTIPLTEEDLAPIFSDADGCPPHLRQALTGYLTRTALPEADASPRLYYQPPYCIAPLCTADALIGELLFVPDSDASRLLPQEHIGYSQLAGLVAGTLERLDLLQRLEQRAERLAATLRKLRRLNTKLVQAERLAAVGQLAAGAAHEINNPLAIIYARTQLMEHREQDDKKKHDLRQMKEQIERITSILSNLMDFARPAPPRMETTSLGEVIEHTTQLVHGGITKKGITLDTHIPPSIPPILGDANQLEQVLLNLIINAEHAVAERLENAPAPAGAISIRLRKSASGRHVILSVTDNGTGMDSENLKKIFDPFFTTKEEGKGTGLGLSTSYSIVASHDGEIRYESAPGKGTTAYVILPATAPKTDALQNPALRPETDTILVVDDEEYIREILTESLEAKGYSVETAANGQEGLECIKAKRYRLLLLDLRMPSRDGLSLLTQIQDRINDMPVIILTGLAGPEEVEQAMKLGAKRCVSKPFEIETLLSDIECVLSEVKR